MKLLKLIIFFDYILVDMKEGGQEESGLGLYL